MNTDTEVRLNDVGEARNQVTFLLNAVAQASKALAWVDEDSDERAEALRSAAEHLRGEVSSIALAEAMEALADED